MQITSLKNRNVKVQIYEPRQSPEQEEVIIDEFEMKAGEEPRDYNIRSATAAYRYIEEQRVDAGAPPSLAERIETMNKEDEQRLEEVDTATQTSNMEEEKKAGQKALKR